MLDHRPAPQEEILTFAQDSYDIATSCASMSELQLAMVIGGYVSSEWIVSNSGYHILVRKVEDDIVEQTQAIKDDDRVHVKLKPAAAEKFSRGFYLRNAGLQAWSDEEQLSIRIAFKLFDVRDGLELFQTVKSLVSPPETWKAEQRVAYIATDDMQMGEVPPLRIVAEEIRSSDMCTPERNIKYRDSRRKLIASFPTDAADLDSTFKYEYSVVDSQPPYGELSTNLLSLMKDYRNTAVDALVDHMLNRRR